MNILDSILLTTKKMANLSSEYDYFDADIIVYINSVLSSLSQLGVGPTSGFAVIDSSQTWSEYIDEGATLSGFVKAYVANKTRLAFDPPNSSYALQSLKESIAELEWRITLEADRYN